MSLPSDLFVHLNDRCSILLQKYIEPIIQAEDAAVKAGLTLPEPDYDSFAAFRLLVHAELEGYFEQKAKRVLSQLASDFSTGNVGTAKFAGLIALFLWKQAIANPWSDRKGLADKELRNQEATDFKNVAQEALGFAGNFISSNNGIKENSIQMLSAIMGVFHDDLDHVLVEELNKLGKKRGDVAHDSWLRVSKTFDSAVIEKERIERILDLTKQCYESPTVSIARCPNPRGRVLERIKEFFFGKQALGA